MSEPMDTVSSHDDEAQVCKAELPLVIASVLTSRAAPEPVPVQLTEQQRLIEKSIELDVIPGLLMAHLERPLAEVTSRVGQPPVPGFDEAHVGRFAEMLANAPIQVAVEHVQSLTAAGVSMDVVFSDLFARAARLLGDQWLADETSFLDVTLGLASLQQLLRRFSPEFASAQPVAPNGRHMLLATVPGEAHTFGMTVVEEYFRRDGWMVTLDLPPDPASLMQVVRSSWFDLVGLSVGATGATDNLRTIIADVRRHSRNQAIRVIVGGSALPRGPDAIAQTGADLFAMTAEDAVAQARHAFVSRKT